MLCDVSQGMSFDEDEYGEEDNLPPPSPPPGSPPPHLFPPRVKTHSINNIHPSILTNLNTHLVNNSPIHPPNRSILPPVTISPLNMVNVQNQLANNNQSSPAMSQIQQSPQSGNIPLHNPNIPPPSINPPNLHQNGSHSLIQGAQSRLHGSF